MRTAAAVLVLAAAVAGWDASPAEARAPLAVKRFLIGHLEANTDRFVATGARGTDNVHRTDVILLVFNQPVNFSSLDLQTVAIGTPGAGGLLLRAEGAFYRSVLREYDEVSGQYVVKKTYRNRVIFDPTRRNDPAYLQNPAGFAASSNFTVTLPGLDQGIGRTVKSARGDFLQRTFRTTFRTLAQ